MKTDKEYPATHSMSTAWYIADEDGNVGIMDFNENGPVPWETEQSSIEELVYGHFEDYQTKDFIAIDLTDEQIDDLMKNPHLPEDEEQWIDCIFQIDLEQEAGFLNLAKNSDFEIEYCISKRRGLYQVFCFECTETRGNKDYVKETSSLKQMLDQGMIKQIYYAKDFFISDKWKDDKVVYEYEFSSAPYFIYAQPYWEEFLSEKIITPANPVKLIQFPPALRNRVHRLPIKFSDCQRFQIAEWVPCRFNTNEAISINGFAYHPTILTNGSEAYVNTSILETDFFEYCAEKNKYKCQECTSECVTVFSQEFTNKPTVIFVAHPINDFDYGMCIKSDEIIRHSIRIPLLSKIPLKHSGKELITAHELKNFSEENIETLFPLNNQHFEETILRFNPHVIIVDDKAMKIVHQHYRVDERHIKIRENTFACYSVGEMEKFREEITKLAFLPYRGIVMPHIITKEEMKQYRK